MSAEVTPKMHLEAKRMQMSHDEDIRTAGYILGAELERRESTAKAVMSAEVQVSQRARVASANVLTQVNESCGVCEVGLMRWGEMDDDPLVQAFAHFEAETRTTAQADSARLIAMAVEAKTLLAQCPKWLACLDGHEPGSTTDLLADRINDWLREAEAIAALRAQAPADGEK